MKVYGDLMDSFRFAFPLLILLTEGERKTIFPFSLSLCLATQSHKSPKTTKPQQLQAQSVDTQRQNYFKNHKQLTEKLQPSRSFSPF
jgi:hypothetical protein